jgi:hypothetical protein
MPIICCSSDPSRTPAVIPLIINSLATIIIQLLLREYGLSLENLHQLNARVFERQVLLFMGLLPQF